MKKTYIAPQLAVFRTSPATIIALSDPSVGIDSGSSVDAGLVDVKGSGDWDIWGNDDSDDDEY